jgi:2-phospho-L-lactate guanylyltransferase
MSLWVIIPVKPLRRSKSRLSSVLTEDERALLNFKMLENTLSLLRDIPSINEILVISRDPGVLALARTFKAKTLQEDGEPGLNTALKRAIYVAMAYAAESVLILPADLPLLTKEEINSVIGNLISSPMMIISPDRHMSGTNMMLVSPPDLIEFSYGPGSFERHVRLAQIKNAKIEVCQFGAVGLDIDLPEDLELFQKLQAFQSVIKNENKLQEGVNDV